MGLSCRSTPINCMTCTFRGLIFFFCNESLKGAFQSNPNQVSYIEKRRPLASYGGRGLALAKFRRPVNCISSLRRHTTWRGALRRLPSGDRHSFRNALISRWISCGLKCITPFLDKAAHFGDAANGHDVSLTAGHRPIYTINLRRTRRLTR